MLHHVPLSPSLSTTGAVIDVHRTKANSPAMAGVPRLSSTDASGLLPLPNFYHLILPVLEKLPKL